MNDDQLAFIRIMFVDKVVDEVKGQAFYANHGHRKGFHCLLKLILTAVRTAMDDLAESMRKLLAKNFEPKDGAVSYQEIPRNP